MRVEDLRVGGTFVQCNNGVLSAVYNIKKLEGKYFLAEKVFDDFNKNVGKYCIIKFSKHGDKSIYEIVRHLESEYEGLGMFRMAELLHILDNDDAFS